MKLIAFFVGLAIIFLSYSAGYWNAHALQNLSARSTAATYLELLLKAKDLSHNEKYERLNKLLNLSILSSVARIDDHKNNEMSGAKFFVNPIESIILFGSTRDEVIANENIIMEKANQSVGHAK